MNKADTNIGTLVKNFRSFVESHVCEKGEPNEKLTHTTYVGGRYSFLGRDYEEFINKYIEKTNM